MLHSQKVQISEIKAQKPPSPVITKQEGSSESEFSDSESYSEQEKEDPNIAVFKNLKKLKEESEKKKEFEQEEEKIESEEDLQIDDEETNLDYPNPTGIMHCLHDSIKRKGNDWTLGLKACIYQEIGRNEIFFRAASSKFRFITK